MSKKYVNNLVEKELLILYKDKTTKKYEVFEIEFHRHNFLHLTGIVFMKSQEVDRKSVLFLEKCLFNKLRYSDIVYRQDGSTRNKLDNLQTVVNIHKTARMVGDFIPSGTKLYTEKAIGDTRVSFGLVKGEANFVPNTLLVKDIRNVSDAHPIKAIYMKRTGQSKYLEKTFESKDFDYRMIQSSLKDRIMSDK